QMTRKGFDNDLAGQLALGQQLVAKYPQSPRAWLALAGAQGALNENADARESMAKALELSPRLYVAHVIMGNNYIFGEPRDFAMALGRANEKAAYAPFRAYVSVYAGDPGAAIAELNRLVASVDGMGVPDPKANKVAALTNVVVIATHTKNRAAVEQALKQLEPLLMQQADEAGNPAFTRGQQAQIAYLEGWWAARRGD